jgi:sec-independent protein translocase protein TatC
MVISFVFCQNEIFSVLVAPLDRLGQELVLLTVTEGFLLQIKTAFLGGLILASPVILWQIIVFVLPALYQKERKVFWSIFLSSVVLFCLGIIFAYHFVLDLALEFLVINCSIALSPMLSASKYLTFVLGFLLPFGIVFEIPIATYLLTKGGILTPGRLAHNRRYVVVIIFILAALLTPPDVISQIMLALPMLVLYEISLFISFLTYKRL